MTYPTEFGSAEMAENAVAKKGYDAVKAMYGDTATTTSSSNGTTNSSAGSSQTSPVHQEQRPPSATPSSNPGKLLDSAAIDRIHGLLGERRNGVWSSQVDVEYKRKYNGTLLPEKWPLDIMNRKQACKLKVESPIEGRYDEEFFYTFFA